MKKTPKKKPAASAAKQSLDKWLVGTPPAPFNAGAIPESPADGITIDRLAAIMAAAREGDADDLFALYGDIVMRDPDFIAGGLQRKAPLVVRKLNASVPSKADDTLRRNRDFIRAALARMKGKTAAIAHAMDSHTGWPVIFIEKIIRPAPAGSGRYYDITELREVPFWRITFKADRNGPAGVPKIKCLNEDGTLTGDTELPTPARYITHRGHLNRSFPDCWGGPLRSIVFWWYFGNWARQACARHLDKTNLPKWVAKAPRSNFEVARRELQRAFVRTANAEALIIPEDAKLDAISTLQKDSVQAFIAFMELCQKQIAKVVAAQTLTTNAQPLGIGSGAADVQADALDSVQAFDGVLLAETLQEQLFLPILQLSGLQGDCPAVSWGEDDDAAAVKVDQLTGLAQAGIEVDPTGLPRLSEIIGLPLRLRTATLPGAPAGLAAFAASGPFLAPGDTRAAFDSALARLGDGAAHDFAAAFGADCAPIAQALRDATGPDDFTARLAALDLAPHRAARFLEDVLAAAAADGFTCSHHTAGT